MTVRSPCTYPNKPQRLQVFAAGLRFDSVLEYLDAQGRWLGLWDGEDTVQTGSADSALPNPAELMAWVLATLHSGDTPLPDTLQEWQAWLHTQHADGLWRVQQLDDRPVQEWQVTLLNVLAGGGMVLVKLELPNAQARWVAATGVECEQGGLGLPRLQGLLLLDPAVDAVWGCGHNAKVALPALRSAHHEQRHELQGQGAVGVQHRLWVYRTLDGGYAACRVLRVIVVRAV